MKKWNFWIQNGTRILCLCVVALALVGCAQGRVFFEHRNTDDSDVMDTGSFKRGTFYQNDYKIDIEFPYDGHPSGDILWSTYFENEGDGERISVDIYGKEGALEKRVDELVEGGKKVQEGVLWGNSCSYYMDEITIAMIPLGEDGYLQVEIDGEFESVNELESVTFLVTLRD